MISRIKTIGIFLLLAFSCWQYIDLKLSNNELVRQHKIIVKANEDKAKTIAKAKEIENEVADAINSGEFNAEFLRRLQQLDKAKLKTESDTD